MKIRSSDSNEVRFANVTEQVMLPFEVVRHGDLGHVRRRTLPVTGRIGEGLSRIRSGRAEEQQAEHASKHDHPPAQQTPLRWVDPDSARKDSGVKQLWAPWRLEYIKSADEQPGCLFCDAAAGADEERLVVRRSTHALALLNKFPYASGHFMVAPLRHVGEFGDLEDAEVLELHLLASAGMGALAETYAPQGYNVGWNLGRIAGAGVIDHVHLHVVPRWAGDTNFMPVLADVKVLPEHLEETRRRLAEAWPG